MPNSISGNIGGLKIKNYNSMYQVMLPLTRWMSYEDADTIASNVGRGLRVLGQEANKPLCVFADTRAEWMLSAQACFKQSFHVVTLYTNLGEDAVIHGINETQAETVITSHELLPKFKKILPSTSSVKNIVYFENPIKKTPTDGKNVRKIGKKINCMTLLDDTGYPKKRVICD